MIFELFSQRNAEKKDIDVYEYENFPQEFRNQVFFIISDFISLYKDNYKNSPRIIYTNIYDIYIRQKGLKELIDYGRNNSVEYEIEIFISQSEGKDFIDFIKIFQYNM